MLQDERLPSQERQQAVEAIVRNSKLQVSLINDMLDMSRIITGKLILQRVVQDLVPVINDVLESVNLAAKSKRIDLTKKYHFQTVSINGDPVRLHQIFWNILSNAIKFSPVGGQIEVRLKSNQANIEIEVEDWGEGIDPKFLPFVFDRFSQQDTSIRRHYGGLGLGLSIVKYLVELHGGKIEAKSDGIGKGSTFLVTFPALIDDVSVQNFSSHEKVAELKEKDKKENQDEKIT